MSAATSQAKALPSRLRYSRKAGIPNREQQEGMWTAKQTDREPEDGSPPSDRYDTRPTSTSGNRGANAGPLWSADRPPERTPSPSWMPTGPWSAPQRLLSEAEVISIPPLPPQRPGILKDISSANVQSHSSKPLPEQKSALDGSMEDKSFQNPKSRKSQRHVRFVGEDQREYTPSYDDKDEPLIPGHEKNRRGVRRIRRLRRTYLEGAVDAGVELFEEIRGNSGLQEEVHAEQEAIQERHRPDGLRRKVGNGKQKKSRTKQGSGVEASRQDDEDERAWRKENRARRKDKPEEEEVVLREEKHSRERSRLEKWEKNVRIREGELFQEIKHLEEERMTLRRGEEAFRKKEEALQKKDEELQKKDEELQKKDEELRKKDEVLRKEAEGLRCRENKIVIPLSQQAESRECEEINPQEKINREDEVRTARVDEERRRHDQEGPHCHPLVEAPEEAEGRSKEAKHANVGPNKMVEIRGEARTKRERDEGYQKSGQRAEDPNRHWINIQELTKGPSSYAPPGCGIRTDWASCQDRAWGSSRSLFSVRTSIVSRSTVFEQNDNGITNWERRQEEMFQKQQEQFRTERERLESSR